MGKKTETNQTMTILVSFPHGGQFGIILARIIFHAQNGAQVTVTALRISASKSIGETYACCGVCNLAEQADQLARIFGFCNFHDMPQL